MKKGKELVMRKIITFLLLLKKISQIIVFQFYLSFFERVIVL